MSAPRVTIPVHKRGEQWAELIVFDFDRLVAIEEAAGQNINAVCRELCSYIPAREAGKEPTEEAKVAAGDRLNLRFVRRFIAGCLGVAESEVNALIPTSGLRNTFGQLMPAFFEAVMQLAERSEVDPPKPAEQPSAG